MYYLPRMRPRRGISGQENDRYKGQRQVTAPFCLSRVAAALWQAGGKLPFETRSHTLQDVRHLRPQLLFPGSSSQPFYDN